MQRLPFWHHVRKKKKTWGPRRLPWIRQPWNSDSRGGDPNSKTLTVTSTRDWTIEQDEKDEWVTISPSSGSASSEPQTVTVTVTDNTGSDRTATIKFTANNGTVSKNLTVKQTGAVAKDYTDLSEVRSMFTGGESVTLGDNINVKATVISNSELNNLISQKAIYVQDGTAGLYIFFDSNHEFAFGDEIEMDLSGATMKLSGGAIQVDALPLSTATKLSDGQATPKEVSVSDFMEGKYESQYVTLPNVQVDDEGEQTFVKGDSHTSVDFVTEDGIRFVVFSSKYSTFKNQTVPTGSGPISGIAMVYNSTMQLIFAQESDYAGLTGERFEDAPAKEMTIREILDAKGGNVKTSGTVMAQYANGFVMSDETASILVYQGYNPAVQVKIGDNVSVTGSGETYSGMVQIADPEITVVSSDNPVSYPEALALDGSKADELLSASEICYIEGTGELVKEDNYYNVYIEGSARSTKICCIYPTEGQEAKLVEFLNSVVKVTGYHIGVYNTSLNTMLVSVEQSGEPFFTVSDETISIGAAANSTATFSINSNVDWTVTSSDQENFQVSETAGNGSKEITVTATENTTGAVREAIITVSTTADVVTKEYKIAVTQSAPASGDVKHYVKITSAPADWSGQYLIVYEGEEGALAFDGSLETLDAVNDYKEVSIEADAIESNTETDALSFTIESVASGYNIKSASGCYIYQTSNANGLKSSTSVPDNVNIITYDSTDGCKIVCSDAVLRFNATSNQMRFRYYKSGSYSNQQPISLYKLSE